MVFNAAQHQRAAVAVCAGANFFGRQPQCAHNAGVEFQGRIGLAHLATKGKAHIGDVFARGGPLKARQIHPHQGLGLEGVGRFFQSFSGAAFYKGLTGVQMACRVVQPQALRRVLFNQQVTTTLRHDGCNGHIGFPA